MGHESGRSGYDWVAPTMIRSRDDFKSPLKLVTLAIMTSLTTVTTILIQIPFQSTTGYLNFGDVMVMISGFVLGPVGGFIAGGVGSMMGDVALGYVHFAPITLVIKGMEGYLVGLFTRRSKSQLLRPWDVVGIILGAIAMLAGYYLAETAMFGAAAAMAELVSVNIFQVTVGGAVSAAIGPQIRGFVVEQDEALEGEPEELIELSTEPHE